MSMLMIDVEIYDNIFFPMDPVRSDRLCRIINSWQDFSSSTREIGHQRVPRHFLNNSLSWVIPCLTNHRHKGGWSTANNDILNGCFGSSTPYFHAKCTLSRFGGISLCRPRGRTQARRCNGGGRIEVWQSASSGSQGGALRGHIFSCAAWCSKDSLTRGKLRIEDTVVSISTSDRMCWLFSKQR
jgi:hypothetical protein